MPVHCIVPWCNQQHKRQGPNNRFFRLPVNDPAKLKKWLDILEIHRQDQFPNFHRVCSGHFGNESFMDPNSPQTSRLRPDALPLRGLERKAVIKEVRLLQAPRDADSGVSVQDVTDPVKGDDCLAVAYTRVKMEQIDAPVFSKEEGDEHEITYPQELLSCKMEHEEQNSVAGSSLSNREARRGWSKIDTSCLPKDACIACTSKKRDKDSKLFSLRIEKQFVMPWFFYAGWPELIDEVLSYSEERFSPFRRKALLCQKHFSGVQFMNPNSTTLCKNAIPDVVETMPEKNLPCQKIYFQVLNARAALKDRLSALTVHYIGPSFKIFGPPSSSVSNLSSSVSNSSSSVSNTEIEVNPPMVKRPRLILPKSLAELRASAALSSSRNSLPLRPRLFVTPGDGIMDDPKDSLPQRPRLFVTPGDGVMDDPVDPNEQHCRVGRPRADESFFKATEGHWKSPFYATEYSTQIDVVSFKEADESKVSCKSRFNLRLKAIVFEAFSTGAYTDLVVVCGGKKYRAHKVVLSAFSDFLKEMFLDCDTEEDIVLRLEGYDEVDVSNALCFLYNGVILVNDLEDMMRLRSVLDELGVKQPVSEENHEMDTNIEDTDFEPANEFADEDQPIPKKSPKRRRLRKSIPAIKKIPTNETDCKNREIQTFICKMCPYKANRYQMLIRHVKTNHNFAFLCRFCHQGFNDKADQIIHQKSHEEAFSVCEQCGQRIGIESLTAHKRRHTMEKDRGSPTLEKCQACEICGKMIPSNNMRRHVRRHREKRPIFECDICSKSFSKKKVRDLHIEVVHSDGARHCCNYCKVVFNTIEELTDHRMADVDRHSMKCPVCEKYMMNGFSRYTHSFAFRTHLREHAKEELEMDTLNCPKCERTFTEERHLHNHYSSHYMPDWLRMECGSCFWGFDTVRMYNTHSGICKKLDNSSLLPYASSDPLDLFTSYATPVGYGRLNGLKCPICNMQLVKTQVKSHLLKHASDELSDETVCPRCDRSFESIEHVRNHMLLHYQPGRKFECSQCFQSFFNEKHRQTHQVACSAGEGGGSCIVCGKMAVSLRLHLLLHAQSIVKDLDSPICPTCPSVFESFEQLKKHMLIHYDPEFCECPMCSSVFRSHARLEKHVGTCTGVRKVTKRTRRKASVDKSTAKKETKRSSGPKNCEPSQMKSEDLIDTSEFWKCSDCESVYTTLDECEMHITLCHSF